MLAPVPDSGLVAVARCPNLRLDMYADGACRPPPSDPRVVLAHRYSSASRLKRILIGIGVGLVAIILTAWAVSPASVTRPASPPETVT